MKKERMHQIVREMVCSGHYDEDIAEEVGCTKGHVQKIKRELGLTVARKDPHDDAEEMIKLYEQGATRAEIAQQLKWSYETVTKILREHGIGKPLQAEVPEPLIIPVRKIWKPEMVIDKGKIYWDVTRLFMETEGNSIWDT